MVHWPSIRMGLEQPVVFGPFTAVVAEDLWFTGCFIGQAYFLAGH